jgi:hypothetical protein
VKLQVEAIGKIYKPKIPKKNFFPELWNAEELQLGVEN